jgi:hypothetical protein
VTVLFAVVGAATGFPEPIVGLAGFGCFGFGFDGAERGVVLGAADRVELPDVAGPAEEVDEEPELTNEAETEPETEAEAAVGAAGPDRLPRFCGAVLCDGVTCRASVICAGPAVASCNGDKAGVLRVAASQRSAETTSPAPMSRTYKPRVGVPLRMRPSSHALRRNGRELEREA